LPRYAAFCEAKALEKLREAAAAEAMLPELE
jgi:hypothetical protein